MRPLATTVAACLLALSMPQDAKATLVTFEMSGLLGCGMFACINPASNDLFAAETGFTPEPDPLNPWTFRAVFTVDTLVQADSPGVYRLNGPDTGMTLSIGQLTLSFPDYFVFLGGSHLCNGNGDGIILRDSAGSADFALGTRDCFSEPVRTLEALATTRLERYELIHFIDPHIDRTTPDGGWRRFTGATQIRLVPEPGTISLTLLVALSLLLFRARPRSDG